MKKAEKQKSPNSATHTKNDLVRQKYCSPEGNYVLSFLTLGWNFPFIMTLNLVQRLKAGEKHGLALKTANAKQNEIK